MILRYALIVLLIVWAHGSAALSSEEIEALQAIATKWSSLALQHPPWNPNRASDACNPPWYGLTCSPAPDAHVIGLNISAAVDAAIPYELGSLIHLQSLILEGCLLSGLIPDTLQKLEALEVWDFRFNNLHSDLPLWITSLSKLRRLFMIEPVIGYLPDTIGDLKYLEELVIGYIGPSNFIGTLPASIGSLTRLKVLDLSSTGIQGTLPPSLENLKALEKFNFESTFLWGPIPASLWTLPNLQILNIAQTDLEGQLPTEWEPLENLKELNLEGTKLSGTITASINRLSNLTSLVISRTLISGHFPVELGQLDKLERFYTDGVAIADEIPDCVLQLRHLVALSMSQCDLKGTIPRAMTELRMLKQLDLSKNSLTGSVPPFVGTFDRISMTSNLISGDLSWMDHPELSIQRLELASNRLKGNLPNRLPSILLDLSHNRLEGSIPWNLAQHPSIESLKLSNNILVGGLPDTSGSPTLVALDLSGNMFSGTIPLAYSEQPNLMELVLRDNLLTGCIPLALITSSPHLITLDLSFNQLTGTLPSLSALKHLTSFSVSSNALSGAIPIFETLPVLRIFSISHNHFSGFFTLPLLPMLESLDLSGNQFSSPMLNLTSLPRLTKLDLSHNAFFGPIAFLPPLQSINLANNSFTGPLPKGACSSGTLRHADFSNNFFSGTIPFNFLMDLGRLPAINPCPITTLNLGGNLLTGSLHQLSLSDVVSLDLSHNFFAFEARELTTFTTVHELRVSGNALFGTLNMAGFVELEYADFSHNSLNVTFNLNFIAVKFNARLQFLSIVDNPLPPWNQWGESGLQRTASSHAVADFPNIECYSLTFPTAKPTFFNYDDAMFEYRQCDCRAGFFGTPPDRCMLCQAPLTCVGANLTLPPGFYAYAVDLGQGGFIRTEPCSSIFGESTNCIGASLINVHQPTTFDRGDDEEGFLTNSDEAESEFDDKDLDDNSASLQQDLQPIKMDSSIENNNNANNRGRGASNRARTILQRASSPLSSLHQCAVGSTGRMCSRCLCDPSGRGPCYFPRGLVCVRCKTILSLGATIVITLLGLVIIFVILTVIMWNVLVSKRSRQVKRWDELSLFKRITYRVIHAVSLGLTPIAILFVQLLAETTNWNSYAIRTWTRLINGEPEGLGLDCFIPSLSQPLPRLCLRLVLPLLVIGFVNTSVLTAEAIYRFKTTKSFSSRIQRSTTFAHTETNFEDSGEEVNQETSASSSIDQYSSNQSSLDTISLLPSDDYSEAQPYPVRALLTTATISILQFFYFGTTLAATEYFFASQQASGKRYVKSQPWMAYDEAKRLRYCSIPTLVGYTLLLPILFVIIVWRIRRSVSSNTTFIYFGTLFTRYATKYYWWEIVSVVLRIVVAFSLRGLSPTDALQPALLITALLLVATLTTSLRPWRRRIENYMSPISYSLLIACLFTSYNATMENAFIFTLIVQIASGLFITVTIVCIFVMAITGDTDYIKRFQQLPIISGPTNTPLSRVDTPDEEDREPSTDLEDNSSSDSFLDYSSQTSFSERFLDHDGDF